MLHLAPYDIDGSGGALSLDEKLFLDADGDKMPNLAEILVYGDPNNSGPTILSPSVVEVKENLNEAKRPDDNFLVYTAKAISPNPNATVTYSLDPTFGDSTKFSIDPVNGRVELIAVPWPLFDSNNDDNNHFAVKIYADDGNLSTSKIVNISLTDVFNLWTTDIEVKRITINWDPVSYIDTATNKKAKADLYKLMINTDGTFHQVPGSGDIISTRSIQEISIHHINGTHLTYRVDAYQSIDGSLSQAFLLKKSIPIKVDLTQLVGYFKSNNTTDFENTALETTSGGFGSEIAISDNGQVLAVGSPLSNFDPGNGSPTKNQAGSITIFRRNSDSSWQSAGETIWSTHPGIDGNFGNQFQLSNNFLVVADINATITDTNGSPLNLATFITVYDLSDLSNPRNIQIGNLRGVSYLDRTSYRPSMTLVADTLVRNLPNTDIPDPSGVPSPLKLAGKVYVYTLSEPGPIKSLELTDEIPESWARFGYNISLSSDLLVVSSPFIGVIGSANNSRITLFYRSSDGTWPQTGITITNPLTTAYHFGTNLDVSNDFLAVTAHEDIVSHVDEFGDFFFVKEYKGSKLVVFRRQKTAEEWSLMNPYILEPINPAVNGEFTETSQLLGRTLIVTASVWSPASNNNTVYLFQLGDNIAPPALSLPLQTTSVTNTSAALGKRTLMIGQTSYGSDTDAARSILTVFRQQHDLSWSKIGIPVLDSRSSRNKPFGAHYFRKASVSKNGQSLIVDQLFDNTTYMGVHNGIKIDDCDSISPVNCSIKSGAVYMY